MIHIVFAIDPTTAFLQEVIDTLTRSEVEMNVIKCLASEESYERTIAAIQEISEPNTIVFMGHGQGHQLYGGESETFKKRSLVKINEMNCFRGKNLLAIACDSADLLKSSIRLSGIVKAIGFKALPTDMSEVENSKRLKEQGITEKDIDAYRNTLVNTIASALVYYENGGGADFFLLYDYIKLLINKRINEAVLKEKNRKLADLLFQMKVNMVLY